MVDFELFFAIWGLPKHISYTDKIIALELFHNNGVNSCLFTSEAVARWWCYVKKVFLKTSPNSQENTCARPEACNFIKIESLAQVFSCEFCEICKNTFFCRTSPVVACLTSMASLRPS